MHRSHVRTLVIVEGPDGAGKTELISYATHSLAPRHCRVVRLGPPTPHERGHYFHRWLARLPAAGEIVFFDRSWYNRAALEPVHGLCTATECEAFLDAVPWVERMLAASGIRVIKLFLAITRETQARRLAARQHPSVLDRAAAQVWPATHAAHARMIARTPPWIVIDNDEPHGRLDALAALVTAMEAPHGDGETGHVPGSAAR